MSAAARQVTIIVPVYRGLEEVRRCLESVLRHGTDSLVGHELLVIDDASPEPDVRAYVDRLSSETSPITIEVLRNEENLGFVKTCNRGIRHATGDVVLLNADTVVTEGWLDRMSTAAQGPDVATVTPLTNFGSICTLPLPVIAAFGLDGPAPRIDECATFVGELSLGHTPEVITGVGFCLYMTRSAIDACGLLDEETFGLGYGEEVDFCLRASSLGFRHLVEDGTFVYHQGGVSFGDRRAEGLKRSSELLHRRYPTFRATNAAERSDDPLRIPFIALEMGLVATQRDRPMVLQLLHSRPGELGGTEKHFWRLMESLFDEFDLMVLQPGESGSLLTAMWDLGDGVPSRHEMLVPGGRASGTVIDDPAAAAALETVLDMFDFDAVHIQNIVHHSLAPLAVLAHFEGPVSCSVRDLYLACPHHWLLYRNKQSCGIPEDLSYCARCLPETRNLDLDYLTTFRDTVSARLDAVDNWVFASQSAVDYFLRAYDVDPGRTKIIEHGAIIEHRRAVRAVDRSLIFDEPLRLAFVGIGWAKKGLPLVNELANSFADTDIELHHFGALRDPISPQVHQHGLYDNNVLPELLHRTGMQIVLLPGPFVETFGHVMTEALIAGLPVIGHRHGALGERIRRHEAGWTVDPEDAGGVKTLIEDLDRCRLEVLRATERAVEVELLSVGDTRDQYAELYRPGFVKATTPLTAPRRSMNETERLRRELRAMATLNRQLQVQLSEKGRKPVKKAARAAEPAAAPSSPSTMPSSPVLAAQARSMARQVRRARAAVAERGLLPTGREVSRRVIRRARSAARR